jgi:hypothetical protein
MRPESVHLVRDPDETADLDGLIREVVPDADDWRRTPNPVLGGRTPDEFIGGPEEQVLRDLLRGAKHGMIS